MRMARVLACVALCVTPQQAQESGFRSGAAGSDPAVRGTVDIEGRARRYAYHFDHNALTDAVAAGDGLVALTASGNLLRFDPGTMRMTARVVVPERATALAIDGSGGVLTGMDDGRIAQVDPVTLDRRVLERGEGTVRWLAQAGDRLVAVLSPRPIDSWPGEPFAAYERRVGSRRQWSVLVRRGTRISRYALPRDVVPNAFALDGTTLWMGLDRGQAGGSLHSMNLENGRTSRLRNDVAVRGLLRTKDGRLLAYGGIDHFSVRSGFVARIESGRFQSLREFQGGRGAAAVDTSRPDAPIDRIVEDGTTLGFWVLSAHRLYRTDAGFSTWSRRAELGGRWRTGSANAVANTPTINTLVPVPPGNDLVTVSRRDGLQRVSAEGVVRHAMPDQLEPPIVDIWPTSIGTLFLPHGKGRYLWRVSNEGWTTVSICPAQLSGLNVSLSVPVQDAGAGIVSFCEPGISPGQAALVQVDTRGDLTVERIWSHYLSYSPDEFLIDSAGGLLGRSGLGHPEIQMWTTDTWRRIGTAAKIPTSNMPARHGRAYVPLTTSPDGGAYIWDVRHGAILRLRRSIDQRGGDRATLDLVTLLELTNVLDAVADGDDILTATPRGIFRYTPHTARVERVPSPPGDLILTVTRDAAGRLWAAGDRAWTSPDGTGRSWQPVDLPMVSPTMMKRIRATAEGGLWLSVDDRGLVELE
jgi:hypothetical protein